MDQKPSSLSSMSTPLTEEQQNIDEIWFRLFRELPSPNDTDVFVKYQQERQDLQDMIEEAQKNDSDQSETLDLSTLNQELELYQNESHGLSFISAAKRALTVRKYLNKIKRKIDDQDKKSGVYFMGTILSLVASVLLIPFNPLILPAGLTIVGFLSAALPFLAPIELLGRCFKSHFLRKTYQNLSDTIEKEKTDHKLHDHWTQLMLKRYNRFPLTISNSSVFDFLSSPSAVEELMALSLVLRAIQKADLSSEMKNEIVTAFSERYRKMIESDILKTNLKNIYNVMIDVVIENKEQWTKKIEIENLKKSIQAKNSSQTLSLKDFSELLEQAASKQKDIHKIEEDHQTSPFQEVEINSIQQSKEKIISSREDESINFLPPEDLQYPSQSSPPKSGKELRTRSI